MNSAPYVAQDSSPIPVVNAANGKLCDSRVAEAVTIFIVVDSCCLRFRPLGLSSHLRRGGRIRMAVRMFTY
jgi:hypothetical protein